MKKTILFLFVIAMMSGCSKSEPESAKPRYRVMLYSGGVQVKKWKANRVHFYSGDSSVTFTETEFGRDTTVAGTVVVERLTDAEVE